MEKFLLRKNPLFEIIVNEDSFEINNTHYIFNNGIYKLDEIKSAELIDKKLDWFSTFFGNIIGFFLGGQIGYEISEAKFEFHFYSGKEMEVKLIDCDVETVDELFQQLQKRLHF